MRHLLFLAIIQITAAVSLLSCKTQHEYVKETKSDTIYLSKTDVRYDSVYVDRFRNVYLTNDTVHNDVWVTEYRYVYRDKADTVYETKVEIQEVDKIQTEYKRSEYDRFVSWGFWILVILLLLGLVWWIIKKIYLKR